MAEPAAVVRLDGASASYRGRRVLGPLSIALDAGCLNVIVGPNGAGKSTLLKLMTGELPPGDGRALLDGADLSRSPPADLARRRAVLPQSSALAFPFTVAELVRLGLEAGGDPRDPDAVRDALGRVGLEGFSGRMYGELSGGEQQRVHLARVLCQIGAPMRGGRPGFLFLDEPVSSLDIRHQLGVLRIAREFVAGGGGVVAILHDLNLAAAFADRLIVVNGGRIVCDGTPSAVITDGLMEGVFRVRLRVGATPPADVPFILPQGEPRA